MAGLGQKIVNLDVVGRADMPVKEMTYLLTCVEVKRAKWRRLRKRGCSSPAKSYEVERSSRRGR